MIKTIKHIISLCAVTSLLALSFISCTQPTTPETKYKVSYDNKGHGTAPSAIEVTENTILSAEQLPILTAEDYTFIGWLDDKTAVKAGSYKVTKDVTLTAHWTEKTYKVTFKNDKGNAPNAISGLKKNSTLTKNQIKTLENIEGFTFAGWTVDNEVFDENYKITKDIIVTAKWIPFNTVLDVTFSKKGDVDYLDEVILSSATEGATIHYTIGDKIAQDTTPVILQIKEACSISAYATKEGMTKSNTTKAEYTIKPYTITYVKGEHVDSTSAPIEKKVSRGYKLTENDFYAFDFNSNRYLSCGWFYSNGKKANVGDIIETDTTLVATVMECINISFDSPITSSILNRPRKQVEIDYALTEEDLSLTTKNPDYKIEYWYYKNTNEVAKVGDQLTSDTTLVAQMYIKDITSDSNFEHLGYNDQIVLKDIISSPYNNLPVQTYFTIDGSDPLSNKSHHYYETIYIRDFEYEQLKNFKELKAVQYIEDQTQKILISSKIFSHNISIDFFDVSYSNTQYKTSVLKDNDLAENDQNRIDAENELNLQQKPGFYIIGWKFNDQDFKFNPMDGTGSEQPTKITNNITLEPVVDYKQIKIFFLNSKKPKNSKNNETKTLLEISGLTNVNDKFIIEGTNEIVSPNMTVAQLIETLDKDHTLENNSSVHIVKQN